MDRPRRPAPEPLDVDVVSVVILGTVTWFVAFVVLLPFRGRLADAGHGDWWWTTLAGWVLGIVGILVSRAQRAARRAAADHAASGSDTADGNSPGQGA